MVWTCPTQGGGDWLKLCGKFVVNGTRGAGRKTWKKCVDDDMRKLGLRVEDAQDRLKWKDGCLGKRLTLLARTITQGR